MWGCRNSEIGLTEPEAAACVPTVSGSVRLIVQLRQLPFFSRHTKKIAEKCFRRTLFRCLILFKENCMQPGH